MKVLHLISGGDTGGAKTHVITLLKELSKSSEIRLVCLSPGVFLDEAVEAGIEGQLLQQKNRFDLSVVKTLAHQLNDESFDIVHCHGARANFVSAFLRRKIHIPIITTVHSDYRLDFEHNAYKKFVFTGLNMWSLKRMDYFLSVTNVFNKMLQDEGYKPNKIFTIYNGIEINHPPVVTGNDHIEFGCVTRMVPIKGVHILLEAIKICVDKGYKPSVRVAGHGEKDYTLQLENYIKDHGLNEYVQLLGFVQDMDSFYQTLDVNILPSLTETFPYALLEGGVRAIATISSNAGGIIEMIEDGKHGLLFESGKADKLAECMIVLMNQKAMVKNLGDAFREHIISNFSNTAMCQRHIEIYKTIINDYKNG